MIKFYIKDVIYQLFLFKIYMIYVKICIWVCDIRFFENTVEIIYLFYKYVLCKLRVYSF